MFDCINFGPNSKFMQYRYRHRHTDTQTNTHTHRHRHRHRHTKAKKGKGLRSAIAGHDPPADVRQVSECHCATLACASGSHTSTQAGPELREERPTGAPPGVGIKPSSGKRRTWESHLKPTMLDPTNWIATFCPPACARYPLKQLGGLRQRGVKQLVQDCTH